jgi:hypothetical protein
MVDPSKPQHPSPKRYDVYVIDSGWNEEMSKVLEDHLPLVETYLAHRDNCYVLDRQQSVEMLKANPQYVGRDPMLIVYDSDAAVEKCRRGAGFRCCLGAVDSADKAAETLRKLL